MNNKKKIIFGSIVGVLIGTLVSVSYAFFTYTNSQTTNSSLVTGNIWMRYGETNTLTLENTMPRSGPIENKYFEFTIEGTNTTENKDIWYDISLVHGNLPTINDVTKNENQRIEDKYLRFKLVEVENNVENSTPLLDNIKYNDLSNRRIYVDKIGHGQTINKTYRLYMWIDNSVGIGNTSSARYSTTEWNELFASMKVNVTGDFNEKYVYTDESCFTTSGSSITGYDINCEKNVVIPNIINGNTITNIGDYAFAGREITSVVIPNSVVTIGNSAFTANNLTSVIIPNSVVTIGFSAFNGTNTSNNNHVKNQISSLTLGSSVVTVGEQAFVDNQITNLILPNSISTIGAGAFRNNQISSLVIPNNVTRIDTSAFGNNLLTYIEINANDLENISFNNVFNGNSLNKTVKLNISNIPSSSFTGANITNLQFGEFVESIGDTAFAGNSIETVFIPNNVTTFGNYVFASNSNIVITCENASLSSQCSNYSS